MQVVVVYESMLGNTHLVADHIAEGLRPTADVTLVAAAAAEPDVIAAADLVVVGGPTHAHGMSWAATHKIAVQEAIDNDDAVDPDAEGPSLREWFHHLGTVDGVRAVAFDTRYDATPAITGRASKGITKRLERHGFTLVAEPESFLVDDKSHLLAGEADRATVWGARLAGLLSGS